MFTQKSGTAFDLLGGNCRDSCTTDLLLILGSSRRVCGGGGGGNFRVAVDSVGGLVVLGNLPGKKL